MKYIVTLLMLVALGLLYDKFKMHFVDDENAKHYKIVKQYFLNKDDPFSTTKQQTDALDSYE